MAQKIAWWRRWASYLWPQVVERATSFYSGSLELALVQGRWQLSSAKAVYSFEDLYANFRDTFAQLRPETWPSPPRRVLLLGLGMGSVLQLLAARGIRPVEVVAIEIDPVVVAWAQKYVLPSLPFGVTVQQADAAAWLAQAQGQCFDCIVVDVFVDEIVPPSLETLAWLQALRDLLPLDAPHVLLYNRLSHRPDLAERTNYFFEHYFQPIFPKGEIISLAGNTMLVARHE